MKKQSRIKQLVLSVLAVVFAGASMLAGGLVNVSEASAFSLSPMNQKVVLNPGESYRDTIIISNPSTSDEDFYYKIEVVPYDVDDDNVDQFESYSDRNMIVDWITIAGNETGMVEPNDSVEVEYVVDVPEDAPAGGQYAAIRVSADEDAKKGDESYGIQEKMAIAYLLYAEVAGETVRQGEIENVSVPGFIFSGNIKGISSIKNTGNVHGSAHYTMKVYPLFSDEEVYTNEEEPESHIILPDKTLYNESFWEGTPAIGLFNVVYTVEFEGVTTEVSKLVIKCPIWLLFLILFVIAALVIWIVMKIRAGKKNSKKTEE